MGCSTTLFTVGPTPLYTSPSQDSKPEFKGRIGATTQGVFRKR